MASPSPRTPEARNPAYAPWATRAIRRCIPQGYWCIEVLATNVCGHPYSSEIRRYVSRLGVRSPDHDLAVLTDADAEQPGRTADPETWMEKSNRLVNAGSIDGVHAVDGYTV
jgi:hypothetical protein